MTWLSYPGWSLVERSGSKPGSQEANRRFQWKFRVSKPESGVSGQLVEAEFFHDCHFPQTRHCIGVFGHRNTIVTRHIPPLKLCSLPQNQIRIEMLHISQSGRDPACLANAQAHGTLMGQTRTAQPDVPKGDQIKCTPPRSHFSYLVPFCRLETQQEATGFPNHVPILLFENAFSAAV